MIESRYILDIFDLAFDDLSYGDLLREQIAYLSTRAKEHTVVGLFIYFNAEQGIEQYRVSTNDITNFDVEGNPIDRIDGVEVRNEELKILADASVHLTNGFINYLEIWNKNGEDYPHDEPQTYELSQIWLDPSKRRTIVR